MDKTSTMQQAVTAESFSDVVKLTWRPRYLIVDGDNDDDNDETDKPIAGDDEKKFGIEQWAALPYNFLVTVCRYLHNRDRYSMAQVCRGWRDATLNPSLWRSHVFYLYCQHEVPQGMVWLSGRADFLRHATVMCFGTFDLSRQEFLRALQQADLLDLDINGAAYWWSAAADDKATCSRVVARISRLVKTQRRLQGFQMRQAMLPFKLGMGVLASVLVASGHTLRRLGLEDFFGDQIAFSVPTMPDRFTKMVCQFTHLSELTINYEYLTDGLLRWLGTGEKDKTVQLNLVSWLTSSHGAGVSKEAWADLARSKRDVRVYLILQNIRSIREVRHGILQPEIPMNRLDLVGVAALEQQGSHDMADLLQHIALCYGKSLTGLRLWSDNYQCHEIETAVLNLLRKTPKLAFIDLHMEIRCQVISVLCEMLKSHVIKLKTLRLARSLTNFVEFEQFRAEVRTCFSLLKKYVPDFHVRAESAPDHSARNDYVFIIADRAGIIDSEEDSYLSSVNTATAMSLASSSLSSTPSTSSSAHPSGDNHNNSNLTGSRTNATTDYYPTFSHVTGSIGRHRGERRFHLIGPNSTFGSTRFRFQWRHRRNQRQTGSRTRALVSLQRKKILACYVFSVFNYGCGARTYSKTVQKKIQTFKIWCYRRLLKVPWTEKSNKEIIQMADVGERLLQQLMKRKLGCAGHIMRGSSGPLLQLSLEEKIEEKRRQGRPRRNWMDDVKE
ncbi:F-box only protein 39-like [Elysia marginata]|uniref:F-box only protein 39-like n=1 Tax=Elysia marginata TaxID=1093978 RepID=A0AAV4FMV0_9GAST|nr:F-box only protein 39-like [Elysia marginata]